VGRQPLRQIGQFSLTLLLSAQGAGGCARSAVLASKRVFTSLIRCRVCARRAVCSCWRSHRGEWAAGWASSSFASAGAASASAWRPAAAGGDLLLLLRQLVAARQPLKMLLLALLLASRVFLRQ
jgi:hypothetical protein